MATEAKCPFTHTAGTGPSNRDWWPNQLNLKVLHQHSPLSSPMGKDFNYAEERSEEHTSELQSPCNLVCRLLLEKKKNTQEEHARRSPTTDCIQYVYAHTQDLL